MKTKYKRNKQIRRKRHNKTKKSKSYDNENNEESKLKFKRAREKSGKKRGSVEETSGCEGAASGTFYLG